jgi:hypothetical protein
MSETANIFSLEYELAKNTTSDINEHVPILYALATLCESVVEMGVRTGVSTRAFLYANVALTSYDIELDARVRELFDLAVAQLKPVQYIQANVLEITIPKTDLLFIDTIHTHEQLSAELARHGNQAQKFIVFHDTYTFGLRGENPHDSRGLITAVMEFLIENPHWYVRIHRTNNNGLTVLERR